ncbi:MAG: hypothetical protein Q8K46_03725, partial [Deltaproteobacteria bacterium]|nr:hypothetical protein [Deltaproteobacteria bacterium]
CFCGRCRKYREFSRGKSGGDSIIKDPPAVLPFASLGIDTFCQIKNLSVNNIGTPDFSPADNGER